MMMLKFVVSFGVKAVYTKPITEKIKRIMSKNISLFQVTSLLGAALTLGITSASDALAQGSSSRAPSLIITSDPLPESLRDKIYTKPFQTQEIRPTDIMGQRYFAPQDTLVTQKLRGLENNLYTLQNNVASVASSLSGIEQDNERLSASYFANVATINTQLQVGTTPANPRLVSRLGLAETNLESLNTNVSALNGLAVEASGLASEASFLLEEARAAFSLPGAVEEDHVQLAQLEDRVSSTMVAVERVLNSVNDDITRISTYLASERNHLRTLALGVSHGDLYGKSLSERPFFNSGLNQVAHSPQAGAIASQPVAALSGPKPLAKISFDKPDVAYEQPIYAAISQALDRYPNARFDLVAVHSTQGNAAQVAIESTKARRNGEKVLRTLTQMGLELERIDLSYSESANISDNEIHLFVK